LGLIDLLLTPHYDAEDFSGDTALETANGFEFPAAMRLAT
jgi:hypothetical protein